MMDGKPGIITKKTREKNEFPLYILKRIKQLNGP
tara:strand:+ start:135 stop:236 length:102 start_codon:yes stop_codon:yes gene_type:complete